MIRGRVVGSLWATRGLGELCEQRLVLVEALDSGCEADTVFQVARRTIHVSLSTPGFRNLVAQLHIPAKCVREFHLPRSSTLWLKQSWACNEYACTASSRGGHV